MHSTQLHEMHRILNYYLFNGYVRKECLIENVEIDHDIIIIKLCVNYYQTKCLIFNKSSVINKYYCSLKCELYLDDNKSNVVKLCLNEIKFQNINENDIEYKMEIKLLMYVEIILEETKFKYKKQYEVNGYLVQMTMIMMMILF